LFFRVGTVFHIDWLERQLEALSAGTRWQRWAIIGLERELMTLRRSIVERILAVSSDADTRSAFAAFASDSEGEIARLNRLMKALRRDGVSDSAAVAVALRQLSQLVR